MKRFLRLFPLLFLILALCTENLSRSNISSPSLGSKHSFCGTYPSRVYDELRKARELRQLIEARKSQFALTASSGATQDIGNIAIIEDDGNIVSLANLFDLAGQDLRISPAGTGAYKLSRQPGRINQNFGTRLPLTDDDFREIPFSEGFQFPFFGTSYKSVFIN